MKPQNVSRRSFLKSAAVAPGAAALAAEGPSLRAVGLRCEYVENPLGIDVTAPRLSWILASAAEADSQSAYQIVAATNEGAARQGRGDLWDSGKVSSSDCVQIPYRGAALKSRQRCYWTVRVWDRLGRASDWSGPAWWEMGLLRPDEWKAKWIRASAFENEDTPRTEPAPYFRREFAVSKPFRKARAYICGLGFYELYVNGTRIGDHVLSPNQSEYDDRKLRRLLYPFDDKTTKRAYYLTYDITKQLKSGANVAGFVLGNGWYNQRDRVEEGWMWYGPPKGVAQIEIEYEDGAREIVATDESWKTATGPILHDGIFTGEIYDARLEMPGWSGAGFDDSGWSPAVIAPAPKGKLIAQIAVPDKVTRVLKAKSVSNPKPGAYVFDAGENIAGWPRIQVQGPRGARVQMICADEMGLDYGQADTYVLRGDGVETYEPRFTWHGFRTVEISAPAAVQVSALEARVVHTAVRPAGTFRCSNPLLNKIYENYVRTQLNNMHCGVPSDCPHRERLGYTGDGHVTAQAAIYSFDMAPFYVKWITDIADAQNKVTGFTTHTAPFEGGGGGPPWGSAYVLLPWYMYLYYGDTRILAEHYAGMKHWVQYLGTRTDADGIVVKEEPGGWFLGEWYPPEKQVSVPPELVGTCYYAHCADLLARIASALDRPEEAREQAALAARIKAAVNKRFLDSARGQYSIGRQGANVFPLAFDIVPKAHEGAVFERLAEIVVNENKSHFDTGFVATPLLLDVLTKYGRADIAYALMIQTDFPSFGAIINKGTTTLWERWGEGGTHNHPMFGGVCRWFYQALAGINPDPRQPGFQHVILRPHLIPGLDSVEASYDSIRGRISVARNGRKFACTIPPGSTATLELPGKAPVRAGSGHHEFTI